MPDILSRLEKHASTFPEKIFVYFHDGDQIFPISYQALWNRSQDYAAYFSDLGIARGGVVVIMLRHVHDLYAAFVGAMMHGAIPSFMPPPTSKQRPEIFWPAHERLFGHIEPSAFVLSVDLHASLASILPKPGTFVDPATVPTGRSYPFAKPEPDQIAFLQHSSGTTGSKKGVMLSHRAVIAQVTSYAPIIGLDSDSLIASWLPLYHDMGLIACFMTPLVTGATVAQMDAIDWSASPLKLLDLIEGHRATHSWVPNFAFNHMARGRRLAKKLRWDLSSLFGIINCSEPCKSESIDYFEDVFADCGLRPHVTQTCYAMAENVFAVSQSKPGEAPTRLCGDASAFLEGCYVPAKSSDKSRIFVSCGRTIGGVNVTVAGPDGQLVEDGMIGEIRISGESLFNGYNGLSELTDKKMRDGWYHTGDMGFLWNEELYVTGRIDDLIIIRGRNYYAHDIEAIISSVNGIKPGRCVVFARENRTSGTTDAVCLAEMDGTVDLLELRREVKRIVEALSGLVLAKLEMFPAGTLIKTTSGKISRELNVSLLEKD